MASTTRRYENCPAFIYDEDGGLVGSSRITEHDRYNVSIRVSGEFKEIKQGSRLNVLIVHDGGASEYNGVARGAAKNEREISLFNHQERDGRNSIRHTVDSPAVIEHTIVAGERVPLYAPLEVTIVNISTTGALVRSPVGLFSVGTVLEVVLRVDGQDNRLLGEIVRLKANLRGTWDYGFKFIVSA